MSSAQELVESLQVKMIGVSSDEEHWQMGVSMECVISYEQSTGLRAIVRCHFRPPVRTLIRDGTNSTLKMQILTN